MHIKVWRHKSTLNSTLSTCLIDDVVECCGLEDGHRDVKVKKETRIPAGIVYKIEVRTVGGFHKRYSDKFPSFHQGMLWIKDVPEFEYILIHIGNYIRNTEGCYLVGTTPIMGDPLSIGSSTKAYKRFYKKVIGAALAGNLTIEFIDGDR